MKATRLIIVTVCLMAILTGCMATGPVISKSELGNLQINVTFPKGVSERRADLYLDDLFIGNVSPDMPVIYARRGKRTVRVEAPGCETYERTLTILGDPNHQVINVYLTEK